MFPTRSMQVSLSFRYVLDGSMKEVFADIIEVERITGRDSAIGGGTGGAIPPPPPPLSVEGGHCPPKVKLSDVIESQTYPFFIITATKYRHWLLHRASKVIVVHVCRPF